MQPLHPNKLDDYDNTMGVVLVMMMMMMMMTVMNNNDSKDNDDDDDDANVNGDDNSNDKDQHIFQESIKITKKSCFKKALFQNFQR